MGHGLSLVTSRRRVLRVRLPNAPFPRRQPHALPEPGLHSESKALSLHQPQGRRRESARYPLLTSWRRVFRVRLLNTLFLCGPQSHAQPELGLYSRSNALNLYRLQGVRLLNAPYPCGPQLQGSQSHARPEPGLNSRLKALNLCRPRGRKRYGAKGPVPTAQMPLDSVLVGHNTKTILNNTPQCTYLIQQ